MKRTTVSRSILRLISVILLASMLLSNVGTGAASSVRAQEAMTAPSVGGQQVASVNPQDHSEADVSVAATSLFADVPVLGKEWMRPWMEAFYHSGITSGCGQNPLIYCPENKVTRAEMAVFLLRAKHGPGYAPPPANHYFGDVPVTGKEWMEPWIDQYYREGMTTGCGGGNYCPENNVTRAEMAVFVLRALHGGGYAPPPASGFFLDVPATGKEWMEPWIIQFRNEGITTGCGGDNYCPENNVTRAEMAVFIGRAYHLTPDPTLDISPPAAISDLTAAVDPIDGSMDLAWTAPGNDGTTGTGSSYQVRYRGSAIITETDWINATPVLTGIPTPLSAGSPQGMTVDGFAPSDSIYFSVRAQDAVPNIGPLSNSPLGTLPSTVDVTDIPSLIAAINAANANGPSADMINLANGTYALTTAYEGNNGLPIITSPITINGNGATLQRGSGAPAFRFFETSAQGDLDLMAMTLTGGHATGNGGAIYNGGGTLRLLDTTVAANTANNDGGGIYSAGTSVEIFDSAVSSNSVEGERGGGMMIQAGSLLADGADVSGNTSYFGGGGIWGASETTLTIVNSAISDNYSGNAVAIWADGASLDIQRSTISRNRSSGGDRAISAYDLVFDDNVFFMNSGGVIPGNVATSRIVNSCIMANMPPNHTESVFKAVIDVPIGVTGFTATDNYWGTSDGPSGEGPGHGDSVGPGIDFTPFLAAPPAKCPSETVITGVHANAAPAYPEYPGARGKFYTAPGWQSELSATVIGANGFDPAITWTIASGGGSLSSLSGATTTYTAPVGVGSAVVRATAVGDPSKYQDLSFNIKELTVTGPRHHATVAPGGSVLVQGGASFGERTFSVIPSGTGSVDPIGTPNWEGWNYPTYFAPDTPGEATVRISSDIDPEVYMDIAITISATGPYTCSNSLISDNDHSFLVSTGGLEANDPALSAFTIQNSDPLIGETQTFTVTAYVKGPAIDPIHTVTVIMDTDQGVSFTTVPLALSSGDGFYGTWQGSYVVPDTHCDRYVMHINVVSDHGVRHGGVVLRDH